MQKISFDKKNAAYKFERGKETQLKERKEEEFITKMSKGVGNVRVTL